MEPSASGKRLQPSGTGRGQNGEPETLAWIVDEFIQRRLRLALDENQEHLKLRERREQLQQQQQQRRQAALMFLAKGSRSNLHWFGSWIWLGFAKNWALLGMLALAALGGAVVEANVTSVIAACPSPKSICYLLRWDKSKVVLPAPKGQEQQPRIHSR